MLRLFLQHRTRLACGENLGNQMQVSRCGAGVGGEVARPVHAPPQVLELPRTIGVDHQAALPRPIAATAWASRVTIAQSYVNLLRNEPLEAQIPGAVIDGATVARFRERLVGRIAGRRLDAPALGDVATGQRAEIQSLDAAIAGSLAQQDLARAAFKPALAVGAEAGIQGEDYGFGPDERYVLASVVLRWNTFRGGADQAALAEARAQTDELRATRDLAEQQVRLQVQRAIEQLSVAEASLSTAEKRAEAATAAFRITARKRDLGQVNQTDFIDARKTQTDADLNLNRVRTEFLARIAELEFAIGDRRAADEELQ